MKIGLISDIHGNIHALDAVLDALKREDISYILCAGDLVCYGATPNEVVQRIYERNIPCVAGNYDAAVGWDLPKASRKPSSPQNEPLKQAALDWTKEVIHPNAKQYLNQLAWTSVFDVKGSKIQTLHAGFDYLDEWLSPDTPGTLEDAAKRVSAPVVIVGHTHQIFTYTCNDVLFINPGPVGRSLDGDPRASFAILNTETNEVNFQRLPYDLDSAVDAIMNASMPNEIGEMIRHGARRIEEVLTA